MGTSEKSFKLQQVFGKLDSNKKYTALHFEESGTFIAAGDSNGRIWIYDWRDISKKNDGDSTLDNEAKDAKTDSENSSVSIDPTNKNTKNPSKSTKNKTQPNGKGTFEFYGQFQSHEPGFDYLKSLEIEERICMLRWLPRISKSLFILSTNDKIIKLWKIYERTITFSNGFSDETTSSLHTDPQKLRIPALELDETVTTVATKAEFKNAHNFHINSISLNCDRETFLSSDDLRINIWNLENSKETFNIVDLKPENMESLTEVITTANFHPTEGHVMVYGTNNGSIKYNDMRLASNCDISLKVLGNERFKTSNQNLSDITSAISDIKFRPNGNEIITRSYVNLTLWDIRNEQFPMKRISVGDCLVPYLPFLFENELIFDKFECTLSDDGNRCVTGSYGSMFIDWDLVENEKKMYKFNENHCHLTDNAMIVPSSLQNRSLCTAFRPNGNQLLLTADNNISSFEEDLTGG